MTLIKMEWVWFVCHADLCIDFEKFTKTAKRVIGRFGWTACLPARFITAILEHHPKHSHVQIYSFERLWRTHLFSCTHSNNIYRVDVTQLQTQERRFGRTGGKIVSTESKRRTDQGLSFFCVNQFLQPPGICSALLQKEKWTKRLVEHLVELKCNIAFKEFQRDKEDVYI